MYRLALYFCFMCMVLMSIFSPACNRAPEPMAAATYTGTSSCTPCHAAAYHAWQLSDHSRAMLPANDSFVKGQFNTRLLADGMEHIFSHEQGKYYIETTGEDGKKARYEILYTLGHAPLQQYICALPGGRFQVFRASWDTKNNKWFMQLAGQKIDAGNWLHWTGNAQNWNTMCASCHTTGYEKNYSPQADTYASQWKESGVGCESCHGPGSNHIAYIESEAYKSGERREGSMLLYAADTTQEIQINTCAPCHARKTDISAALPGTREVMNHMIPETPDHESFYADGQIKEEDYEYTSFLQSKMYRMHIKCSHCHDVHSGKTKAAGNALCISCHASNYNTQAHHFHAEKTEASNCVSCHMPARTYMGNDVRRDHSFRIPRPDLSVSYGTPNACNGCHTNKNASWAAAAIEARKGSVRPYHFSQDLLEGARGSAQGQAALIHLISDTTQPAMARAAATVYLSRYGNPEAWKQLLIQLHNHSALVRYQALLSLQQAPPAVWQDAAFPLLSDHVAAVRLAAAQLFQYAEAGSFSPERQEVLNKAANEYFQFLQQQTDFAVGNVMLADYYLNMQQPAQAARWYERALNKDPELMYAVKNLAVSYSSEGRNKEALVLLEKACLEHPQDAELNYQLALLFHENGDAKKALNSFEQAHRKGLQTEALFYNHALLLQEQQQIEPAIRMLKSGMTRFPGSDRICFALCVMLEGQKQTEEAQKYARKLYSLSPADTRYQQVFRHYKLMP